MFGRKKGVPLGFIRNVPSSQTQLHDHVLSALARKLPEADGKPLEALTIVANGPSARGRVFSGPTLALNGALGLFKEPPTYWAACDSQALVADFLTDPPEETTYLIASRCHPSVFDRLKDRKVRVWHVGDVSIPGARSVPPATSITLSSLLLMHRLGWRKFDIYGWDCCFGPDGAHHANPSGKLLDQVVRIDVGSKRFSSTASWGAEIDDALRVLPTLEWCGAQITVHGDGLIAHACREFSKAA